MTVPQNINLKTLIFVYRSLNIYTADTGFQILSHDIQLRQTGNLRIPSVEPPMPNYSLPHTLSSAVPQTGGVAAGSGSGGGGGGGSSFVLRPSFRHASHSPASRRDLHFLVHKEPRWLQMIARVMETVAEIGSSTIITNSSCWDIIH
ncbi:uncharacterized protein LOC123506640 [Portunus trituberculatus]|uniref:uncharacterized protein LOC123506640 n=1 Tax=Portunus trituberculatus TaxID=210409 RepID=UPI001E1CB108|nr:uncharacterized protein LOC123506640 [Portunus trituberculatus]